jgi:hypothetical protein
VLELRPKLAWNKGSALIWILGALGHMANGGTGDSSVGQQPQANAEPLGKPLRELSGEAGGEAGRRNRGQQQQRHAEAPEAAAPPGKAGGRRSGERGGTAASVEGGEAQGSL